MAKRQVIKSVSPELAQSVPSALDAATGADAALPLSLPLAESASAEPNPTKKTRHRAPKPETRLVLYSEGGQVPAPTFNTKQPKFKHLPKNSIIRKKVLAALAMEINGATKAEVAAALQISEHTIASYKYLAGKNGWLPRGGTSKDTIEYELSHKILENLAAALSDSSRNAKTGMTVGTEVALRLGESTIFKSFDQPAAVQGPQMNVLSLTIVQPPGDAGAMRAGSALATPRVIEAELVKEPE